jgi:hypothetical protein
MPRGGFGRGGFGGGGFGRGFGMRRYGPPLVMPMGGWGMGMGGYGSPLLTSLLAGGVGYTLGSNAAQQNQQQTPVYQPYPYPYQAPPQATSAPGVDNGQLAQLKLLGDLRNSGVLTDDEFERQKQRLLGN